MSKVTRFTSDTNILSTNSDNQNRKAYPPNGGEPPMINERLSRLEAHMDHIRNDVSSLHNEMANIRWWILSTCLATIIGVAAIIIAFSQYQTSWLQQSINQTSESLEKSSDKNWDAAQKALDRIESIQIRLERIDALRKKDASK